MGSFARTPERASQTARQHRRVRTDPATPEVVAGCPRTTLVLRGPHPSAIAANLPTMPEVLSARRLNRALLARQALLAREPATAEAMTARLVGLQAQEPAPPFVGLYCRVEGFRAPELLDALHTGRIVRATAMRGTIHLLTAEDYAAHRMALQPLLRTVFRLPEHRAIDEGVDAERLMASAHRLLDDEPRPIAALRAPLAAAFPGHDGAALAHVARLLLPLVQVPTPGHPAGFAGNAAFAPAEHLVGEPLAPEGPPHALVRRYLAAFGPATAADVTKWSGLTGVRAVLDGLDGLETFHDEQGRTLFDLPDAPRPAEDVRAPVRFLPRFDNAVLSHADPTRIFAPEHRPRFVTKNGIVAGTVLVDGVVAGTWEPELTGARPTVQVTPFRALSKRDTASVVAEGRRLLRFLAPGAKDRDVAVG